MRKIFFSSLWCLASVLLSCKKSEVTDTKVRHPGSAESSNVSEAKNFASAKNDSVSSDLFESGEKFSEESGASNQGEVTLSGRYDSATYYFDSSNLQTEIEKCMKMRSGQGKTILVQNISSELRKRKNFETWKQFYGSLPLGRDRENVAGEIAVDYNKVKGIDGSMEFIRSLETPEEISNAIMAVVSQHYQNPELLSDDQIRDLDTLASQIPEKLGIGARSTIEILKWERAKSNQK